MNIIFSIAHIWNRGDLCHAITTETTSTTRAKTSEAPANIARTSHRFQPRAGNHRDRERTEPVLRDGDEGDKAGKSPRGESGNTQTSPGSRPKVAGAQHLSALSGLWPSRIPVAPDILRVRSIP